MHKIDGLDSTPERTFQDFNPSAGILGTVLTAKWLNQVQEELVGIVERADLTPNDADNAQVLQALQAIYGSGIAGGSLKNALINGGFDIWQRGLSRSVTNVLSYTADRWAARADFEGAGSGTATFTRQDFGPGQTDVPGARHYLRWVQNTVATVAAPAILQRVENIERFSGGKISISFHARAAAPLVGAMRIFQDFGTGGSASVTVGVQAFTANTAWTRFTHTFDCPSLSGLTFGTNPSLRVSLTLANGVAFTFELADFQVELAEEASGFDRRPLALEVLLSSRYYQKSYALDQTPGTDGGTPADARRGCVQSQSMFPEEDEDGGGSNLWYEMASRLVVPMRSTPTVTWYKPATAGTAGVVQVSQTAGPNQLEDLAVDETRQAADSLSGYPHTSTGGGTNFNSAFGHWTADAEL